MRLEADVSDFTTGMAQAAATAALLRNQLDGLNRTRINVSTNVNSQLGSMSQSANRADQSINQLTGRLAAFADAALILGPGLVPIGAVGVQALGGLAAAATAAALAGGAAVVAFQGVGDAVKAVDEYQLEPTVANLEKAQAALDALGPSAASFVTEFQKFQPVLTEMRDSAANGFFPGLTASLDDFRRIAPQIEKLLEASGRAAGSMAEDFAGALASGRWTPFLQFLTAEVPQAMGSLSRTMGDLTHGLSELFMAADPGNDRFLSWLEDVATGFDNWASSSEGRDDIKAFLDYARETGPDVAELFSSLVDGLAGLVRAAAPLGGPVLDGITAVADLIGTVANSDLGTPIFAGVLALRLYARGAALAASAQARLNASIAATTGRTTALGAAATVTAANLRALNAAGLTGTALGAALVAPRASDVRRQQQQQRAQVLRGGGMALGLGLAASGVADQIGLMNTAMLSMAGPVGAAVGLLIDFTQHTNGVQDAQANMNAVLADSASTFADVAEAQRGLASAQQEYVASFGSVESLFGSLGSDPVSTMMESWKLGFDALDGNLGTLENAAGLTKTFSGETQILGRNLMSLAQQMGDTTPITAADLLDPDVDRVQGILETLTPALSEMGIELDDLATMSPTELATLADDLRSMNGELLNSTSLLEGFTASLAAAQAVLTGRADWRSYEAAIDNATEAIKRNGEAWRKGTVEGRENSAALDAIAASGLKVAESLEGVDRRNFLKGLRGQIRETAEAIGMPRARIRDLISDLGLLGQQKPKPQVDLEDKATAKAKAARAKLQELGIFKATPTADLKDLASAKAGRIVSLIAAIKSKTVTLAVNEVRTTTIRTFRSGAQAVDSADGSTVPKDGGPYADRFPYMLAPGEEVISNRAGQADRHRGLLKAINAGRLADGGTASADYLSNIISNAGSRSTVSNFSGDGSLLGATDALAFSMARLSRMSLSELKQRERLLKQEIKREERENEASKQRLDLLKQERDALMEAVRARLTSNLWERGQGVSFDRPENWATMSREDRIRWEDQNAQIASFQQGSAADTLRADIANAQELEQLFKILESKGLDGAALLDLQSNADIGQIRAYANGSRADLAEYERLYEQRAQVVNQTAGVAAMTSGLTAQFAAATKAYQESNQQLKQANNRLERLEKAVDGVKKAAGETGPKAFADRLNNVSSGAGRR